jgi:hypothetical protein
MILYPFIQQRSMQDNVEEKKRLNKNPNFFIFCRQKKEKISLDDCALLCILHSIWTGNAFVYDVDDEPWKMKKNQEKSHLWSILKEKGFFYLCLFWFLFFSNRKVKQKHPPSSAIPRTTLLCLYHLQKNHLIRIVFLMWRACVWKRIGTLRFR